MIWVCNYSLIAWFKSLQFNYEDCRLFILVVPWQISEITLVLIQFESADVTNNVRRTSVLEFSFDFFAMYFGLPSAINRPTVQILVDFRPFLTWDDDDTIVTLLI